MSLLLEKESEVIDRDAPADRSLEHSERALLLAYEKSTKSSLYGSLGMLFIIFLCFIQMSIGAIFILSQMPETKWIVKSLVSNF